MVSFQWDAGGNDLLGSYKMYYIDDLMWWSQIYTHYYGQNFLYVYPAVRDCIMSDIWLSLPNGYSNDFVTNGNVLYTYLGAFGNLLSDSDREVMQYYLGTIDEGLLPYSRTLVSLDAAAGPPVFDLPELFQRVAAGALPDQPAKPELCIPDTPGKLEERQRMAGANYI